MHKNAFWDKKIQTASIQSLKKLQLQLLKRQLHYAFNNSILYRRKMKDSEVRISDIRTLEDLAKLPLLTRRELEQEFKKILCVPLSHVATIRQTSGTTGTPMTLAHTKGDTERIANASARKLAFHGVTKKDVVQVTAQYGLSQGAWSIHGGVQRIGACEIPVGPGDTEKQIRIIKELGTTVLYGVTNYHLRIAEVAKKIGEDLTKTRLRTGICVSEKPTAQQKERLKKDLGYENIFLDYGTTEFPGFSVYCDAEGEAHHVWGDYYICEVVDPETHEIMDEGEKGELVITSLQTEAVPLIRYLSRDITSRLDFEKCGCGMCHPKIGIDIDRRDFMVKVRGVSIFPSRMEALLAKFPELTGRCQVVVDKSTPKQEFLLKAESNSKLNRAMQQILKKSVQREVKIKIGTTVDDVIFVPLGTFEDKMKKSLIIE